MNTGRGRRISAESRGPSRVWLGLALALASVPCLIGGTVSGLAPGLTYTNDRVRSVPWSIHVLQIDRSRKDLELVTTFGEDEVLGVTPLSGHVHTIPAELGRPLAAINGDFFSEHEPYTGDPRGLQIVQGELVSAPDGQGCLWIDASGVPHLGNVISRIEVIWPKGESVACGLNEERSPDAAVLYTARIGASTRTGRGRELVLERAGTNAWLPLAVGRIYTAQVRQVRDAGNTRLTDQTMVLSLGPSVAAGLPDTPPGTSLRISTGTLPSLRGARMALGGGPVLVHGGRAQAARAYKSGDRHPRAAVGWNANSFFFVAVDGRQRGLSVGMTLPELAAYLVQSGCEEALNLDGGGSVELWVGGRILNSPCYGHERRTGNALVLLQTARSGAP